MNTTRKILSSAVVISALMISPAMAFADTVNATSSTGVVITSDIVRVAGASVTSVSGNVITAVTNFGNVVMNWIVNVSATTKLNANGSGQATTTDIKVGDKVAFAGTLSASSGSTLTVAASKVRDITNGKNDKDTDGVHKAGTVHANGRHSELLGLKLFGGLHVGDDK